MVEIAMTILFAATMLGWLWSARLLRNRIREQARQIVSKDLCLRRIAKHVDRVHERSQKLKATIDPMWQYHADAYATLVRELDEIMGKDRGNS